MTLVLDASLAVACMFEEEVTEANLGVFARVAREGAHVPSLWHLEVANAFQIAIRRGRSDEGHSDRSLARLARLPIVVDDETETRAWTVTLALARTERLTVYDAAYLELAIRLALPLASCDASLCDAARRRGVPVLPG